MYRAARIHHCIECLKRCGIPNPNIRGLQEDFRLCYKHKMETIYKVVEYTDIKGEQQFIKTTMVLLIAYDDKNRSVNRNNTCRRSLRSVWKDKVEETKRLSVELATQLGVPEEEWTALIMQTLKIKQAQAVNTTSNSNNSTPGSNMSKKRMKIIVQKPITRTPKFLLNHFEYNIINVNTGFPSLSALLCYIIIINKGDIDSFISNKTTNKLSWFEEWLFFLTSMGPINSTLVRRCI
jgi:hypothetical protein